MLIQILVMNLVKQYSFIHVLLLFTFSAYIENKYIYVICMKIQEFQNSGDCCGI